ncbi:oxygenase MpaB family protein [Nocardiopsis lambiniae]|uniref:Oxygenase MpaB family protein n=1 Tax=Nocardiopsis lambiniae TaxID=3075539 RepID=A0ABU2M9Q5_9ACTN|nr:oxygenase MpaB family protein [Nocardiopsis sp. DSM 44743]MDT0329403.1 oxygenase MpaB family protein [Nocardiopsis sp. DSM 44743]
MRPTVAAPESVTWTVHLDRAMWVAGVRALMLQALHPVAMRGVWQRSDFRSDPTGRLLRTAHFVAVTTYGSPEEADRLGEHVRRVHRSLSFTDPDTGRRHRVDEHDLLVWVHCAEVTSYLETAVRAGVPLTPAEWDRYLDEQSTTATYVGLSRDDVPRSVADMRRYLASVRPVLRVTPEARRAVRFLLWPKVPDHLAALAPLKPLWFPVGALSYATLPDWARREYGVLPALPGAGAAATAGLRALRRGLDVVPERYYNLIFDEATVRSAEEAKERLLAAGYRVENGFRALRSRTRFRPPQVPAPRSPADA